MSIVVASSDRVRRCFICRNAGAKLPCTVRVFLNPSDTEDYIPDCPEHGRMVRDPNRLYRGIRPAV
jgi:hypothetical protein